MKGLYAALSMSFAMLAGLFTFLFVFKLSYNIYNLFNGDMTFTWQTPTLLVAAVVCIFFTASFTKGAES